MNLPTSPSSPSSYSSASGPTHRRPGAPSGKQSRALWLSKTARGFLALAGLALASCAHCPMCNHGETRGGTCCENHCGDQACPVCAPGKGAKGKGAKAAAAQPKVAPAAEKRRAKAATPGEQPPPHNPLWFRWR